MQVLEIVFNDGVRFYMLLLRCFSPFAFDLLYLQMVAGSQGCIYNPQRRQHLLSKSYLRRRNFPHVWKELHLHKDCATDPRRGTYGSTIGVCVCGGRLGDTMAKLVRFFYNSAGADYRQLAI